MNRGACEGVFIGIWAYARVNPMLHLAKASKVRSQATLRSHKAMGSAPILSSLIKMMLGGSALGDGALAPPAFNARITTKTNHQKTCIGTEKVSRLPS